MDNFRTISIALVTEEFVFVVHFGTYIRFVVHWQVYLRFVLR